MLLCRIVYAIFRKTNFVRMKAYRTTQIAGGREACRRQLSDA